MQVLICWRNGARSHHFKKRWRLRPAPSFQIIRGIRCAWMFEARCRPDCTGTFVIRKKITVRELFGNGLRSAKLHTARVDDQALTFHFTLRHPTQHDSTTPCTSLLLSRYRTQNADVSNSSSKQQQQQAQPSAAANSSKAAATLQQSSSKAAVKAAPRYVLCVRSPNPVQRLKTPTVFLPHTGCRNHATIVSHAHDYSVGLIHRSSSSKHETLSRRWLLPPRSCRGGAVHGVVS